MEGSQFSSTCVWCSQTDGGLPTLLGSTPHVGNSWSPLHWLQVLGAKVMVYCLGGRWNLGLRLMVTSLAKSFFFSSDAHTYMHRDTYSNMWTTPHEDKRGWNVDSSPATPHQTKLMKEGQSLLLKVQGSPRQCLHDNVRADVHVHVFTTPVLIL